MNVLQKQAEARTSTFLSIDDFVLKPHLLLVKYSTDGVAAPMVTTRGFGQGGGYKKKKGKTQHLTAGQLAAQKAKQEEERRKNLEMTLGGGSLPGSHTREPHVLKHLQVAAPTLSIMSLCGDRGSFRSLSEASKELLNRSIEQAKALRALIATSPRLGEAGSQHTVETGTEGVGDSIHVEILPSCDAAAVTFSTVYDKVLVDVGTAIFSLVPVGSGRVAIRQQCFTYPTTAPASEKFIPGLSYYALVTSVLNRILGRHAPMDASGCDFKGLDVV